MPRNSFCSSVHCNMWFTSYEPWVFLTLLGTQRDLSAAFRNPWCQKDHSITYLNPDIPTGKRKPQVPTTCWQSGRLAYMPLAFQRHAFWSLKYALWLTPRCQGPLWPRNWGSIDVGCQISLFHLPERTIGYSFWFLKIRSRRFYLRSCGYLVIEMSQTSLNIIPWSRSLPNGPHMMPPHLAHRVLKSRRISHEKLSCPPLLGVMRNLDSLIGAILGTYDLCVDHLYHLRDHIETTW